MRTVQTSLRVHGSVHEAEMVWLDTRRWWNWVQGLQVVVEVSPAWPEPGSQVVWESGPAGRGRVVERVLSRAALEEQTVEVDDDQIHGRQQVAFAPAGEEVEVALALKYEIKQRSLFTPVVDRLFIRKEFERSLRLTLERFASELATTRARNVG